MEWHKKYTESHMGLLFVTGRPLEKVNGTRSAAIAMASSAGSGIWNTESEIRIPATVVVTTESDFTRAKKRRTPEALKSMLKNAD